MHATNSLTDTLNMFYLTTHSPYDFGHMVKDQSDSERGKPLSPLHGLLFPISRKRFHCRITPMAGPLGFELHWAPRHPLPLLLVAPALGRPLGFSLVSLMENAALSVPTDMIAYTTAFVTPVVEHWVEREIAQWAHNEGSIRRPIAP